MLRPILPRIIKVFLVTNYGGTQNMKFAKIIFWIAGTYGLVIITPLYFLANRIGQQDPPPITHPGFYYGFVGVAIAWQIAFSKSKPLKR